MDSSHGRKPLIAHVSLAHASAFSPERRAIEQRMARLARLERAMREAIHAGLPPDRRMPALVGADLSHWLQRRASATIAAILTGPHSCGSRPMASPAICGIRSTAFHLSRQALDQLARSMNEPPLRDRPVPILRALHPKTDRAETDDPPLVLQIDHHLRLRLDSHANTVRVERKIGTRWHCTDVHAVKDGAGGIQIDPHALERLAGPLSSELWQILRPGIVTQRPEGPSPHAVH